MQGIGPFVAPLILGGALFVLTGMNGVSDFFFSLGSGFLVFGLIRLLSNLRMFASFAWGVRFLKRLFMGEARDGRTETEDYARYRANMGGHRDAGTLLMVAGILMGTAALTAFLIKT
ncbi:MAG: DUF3899 domain-containing protein [Clostridia bacterium]|nr:DUF3899 domain-containing protein [Clostridia bacterium]